MKIEVDVEQVLESLRTICRSNQDEDSEIAYFWTEGFIEGALTIIGKDWKDLCAGCVGCSVPKYQCKNMKTQK